jgi:hypothetical protein
MEYRKIHTDRSRSGMQIRHMPHGLRQTSTLLNTTTWARHGPGGHPGARLTAMIIRRGPGGHPAAHLTAIRFNMPIICRVVVLHHPVEQPMQRDSAVRPKVRLYFWKADIFQVGVEELGQMTYNLYCSLLDAECYIVSEKLIGGSAYPLFVLLVTSEPSVPHNIGVWLFGVE